VFEALCVEHNPAKRGTATIIDEGGVPVLPRSGDDPRRVPQSVLSISPKFLARIEARIPLGSHAPVDQNCGRGLPDGGLDPQIFTMENKSEIEKILAVLHKSP
jgi:hypothetical protein